MIEKVHSDAGPFQGRKALNANLATTVSTYSLEKTSFTMKVGEEQSHIKTPDKQTNKHKLVLGSAQRHMPMPRAARADTAGQESLFILQVSMIRTKWKDLMSQAKDS